MDRTCGSCSLCCKVMAVDAIPKGRGVWCRHIRRQGGCSVYDDRPASCRSWSCAWLLGHPAFLETDRPDRSGIVASVVGSEVHLHDTEAAPELVDRIVATGGTAVLLARSGRATARGPGAADALRRHARARRRL